MNEKISFLECLEGKINHLRMPTKRKLFIPEITKKLRGSTQEFAISENSGRLNEKIQRLFRLIYFNTEISLETTIMRLHLILIKTKQLYSQYSVMDSKKKTKDSKQLHKINMFLGAKGLNTS